MKMSFSLTTLKAVLAGGAAVVMCGCGSVIESRPKNGAPESITDRDKAFHIPADAYESLGYRMDWRGFPVLAPHEMLTRLVIYPDALMTQASGSEVTVIEPSNGSIRWSTGLKTRLTKFVSITRENNSRYGDMFVVASEADLYLLATSTGTLLSRQPFETVVNTGTVQVQGAGIYGTETGELLCHQYTNSIKLWGVRASSGSYERPPINVGPAVVGAVTTTGNVSFVDLGTGHLIGRGKIFGGPGAELAANDSALYIASEDQSLYAFLTNGRQLWRRRTSLPLHWAPTATADTVYCTIDEGLTAFDAGTGETRWTSKDAAGVVLGKRRDNLLVWDGHTMFLVDAQRGDVMNRQELPDVLFIKMSKFEEGDMYVVSTSGVIAKFISR